MRSTGDFPQTLRPILYALQNFDRNFANLADDTYRWIAKCLVLHSTSGPAIDVENSVQIDA